MTLSLHPLDAATQLKRVGPHHYSGAPSPLYANFGGPFGGATAATLLRAALEDGRLQGDPVALTVNFCGPIINENYEIFTRVARAGRTTQHWTIDLLQKGVVAATASLVCVGRGPSWSHAPLKAPPAPAFEEVASFKTLGGLPWVDRYDFRFVSGALELGARKEGALGPSHSLLWLQDQPPRPLDFIALTAMSDAFFLRFVHVRGVMTKSGTISMTTYFHANAKELADIGAAPILGDVDCAIFHDTLHDQSCALWSQDGRLLANGVQIVWFKE